MTLDMTDDLAILGALLVFINMIESQCKKQCKRHDMQHANQSIVLLHNCHIHFKFSFRQLGWNICDYIVITSIFIYLFCTSYFASWHHTSLATGPLIKILIIVCSSVYIYVCVPVFFFRFSFRVNDQYYLFHILF